MTGHALPRAAAFAAAAAVVLVPACAQAATHHPHTAAAPLVVSARAWEQNGWTVHLLDGSYPTSAGWAFNRSGSLETGTVYDGFAATVVDRFTSEATFASQVSTIPAGTTVSYDNENWADTPQAEIDDPWTYMAAFVSLAHQHGLIAEVTPARDLGNDPTSVCPKQSGENLDHWYGRCDIAGTAGTADIYVVQDQVDTASPAAYLALFNAAYERARAVNSSCEVLTELSHNYGTAQQAYSAATQTGIDTWAGVFYSGANDAASLGLENDTLSLFEAGGY